MKKIGICGHFNIDENASDGQTVKTRVICKELEKIYGTEEIIKLDTANWRNSKIKFLWKCIELAKKAENIIIITAHNGVKVLIPLFSFISTIINIQIHYIIVGAWLPNLLEKNKYLIKPLRKVDYIYGQTDTLIKKLSELGIRKNTYLMPNFKESKPIDFNFQNIDYEIPYKLCILSRINYKKGVESAINVISKINQENNKNIVELDIYGPIEEDFEENFNLLLEKNKECVRYCGIVEYNKTTEVIKDYYLLLFPTKYYTEGFPGTILDSYLSGVPALASRWESYQDIINEEITGYTFRFDDDDDFHKKLLYLIENQDLVLEMKKNCIKEAEKFSADNVMEVLIENISK